MTINLKRGDDHTFDTERKAHGIYAQVTIYTHISISIMAIMAKVIYELAENE